MFFDLLNNKLSFKDYINKILAKNFNIFIIIDLNNTFIYIDNLASH